MLSYVIYVRHFFIEKTFYQILFVCKKGGNTYSIHRNKNNNLKTNLWKIYGKE